MLMKWFTELSPTLKSFTYKSFQCYLAMYRARQQLTSKVNQFLNAKTELSTSLHLTEV